MPARRGALPTAAIAGAPAAERAPALDADDVLQWDVPEDDAAPGRPPELYAWLAGEAGMVQLLRRHLLQEAGPHRGALAFMGQWRLGRSSA